MDQLGSLFSFPKVHPVTLSRPRLHRDGTGKGAGEPQGLLEWAAKSGLADSRVG